MKKPIQSILAAAAFAFTAIQFKIEPSACRMPFLRPVGYCAIDKPDHAALSKSRREKPSYTEPARSSNRLRQWHVFIAVTHARPLVFSSLRPGFPNRIGPTAEARTRWRRPTRHLSPRWPRRGRGVPGTTKASLGGLGVESRFGSSLQSADQPQTHRNGVSRLQFVDGGRCA